MSECTHDCSTCNADCGERKEKESFLKKPPVVNARITNKELEQVGIEPDMESISGEEISKMFQQEFKE